MLMIPKSIEDPPKNINKIFHRRNNKKQGKCGSLHFMKLTVDQVFWVPTLAGTQCFPFQAKTSKIYPL